MTTKVEGLKALEKAMMTDIPKAARRKVLIRSLKKAFQPVVDSAKSRAPVRSGALRDSIQMWVQTEKQSGKHGFSGTVEAGPKKTGAKSKAAVMQQADYYGRKVSAKGLKGGVWYAAILEHGSKGSVIKKGKNKGQVIKPTRAQPFLGPAYDAKAMGAIDIFAKSMWKEIEIEAAKAVRKGTHKVKGLFR